MNFSSFSPFSPRAYNQQPFMSRRNTMSTRSSSANFVPLIFGRSQVPSNLSHIQQRVKQVVRAFIENPTCPTLSQNPLISHVLLKNILHKNLVLRLRTGAVREFLTMTYGNYHSNIVEECPSKMAECILASPSRARVWYDVVANMKDNIVSPYISLSSLSLSLSLSFSLSSDKYNKILKKNQQLMA
jgi:hypothetical protein